MPNFKNVEKVPEEALPKDRQKSNTRRPAEGERTSFKSAKTEVSTSRAAGKSKDAKIRDLPAFIQHIYQSVDAHGNELGALVVKAIDRKGQPSFSSLDLVQLAQGRHDDVARLAIKAGMHEYLSPKRSRELGATIMQKIGKPIHLVIGDGLKCVNFEGKEFRFYVLRGVVFPLGGMPPIEIATVLESVPLAAASCDVDVWNEHIGRHLKGNPYPLAAVLAALSSALIRTFNVPRLILALVGQSSMGKTTVQQIVQSLREQAKDIENCSGTTNGIRVRLEQNQDCPAFLDELHLGEDPAGLIKLIFMVGNGANRKTSTSDQQASIAPALTCGLITSSEKALAEIVTSKRITLTEGISARYIELVIGGKQGVFHNVPESLTPKQFSDHLKTACETYYGAIWEAWISKLSKNHAKISEWLPKHLLEIEAELCHGLEIEDRVTLRMVRGLTIWVIAGYMAVQMKLLKLSRSDVMEAVKLVLREHLARQKHGTTPIGEKVIQSVRDLIDRNSNRFPSLSLFDRVEQSGIYGYTKGHGDERLYLFLPGVFEELIGAQFGTAMATQKLSDAGYLSANSDGFQRQVRMPDSGESKGGRKRFYAVKASIRFDHAPEAD